MNKNTFKKIGVFAGAIVLSGTISYSTISNCFDVKPLAQNNYPIYKIDLKEYKENGINLKSYYSKDGNFNKNILCSSVFVKTPYYTDETGNIKRDVYSYNISNLSQDNINFIIENSENQNLILSQSYMKTLNDALSSDYSLLNEVSGLNFINSESSNKILPNNEFEVYFAEYDNNSHEILYYNSKYMDNIVGIGFVAGNVILAGIIYSLYEKITNKKKKKIRMIENVKEE